MSRLTEFTPATAVVQTAGDEFVVSGLTVEAVVGLIRHWGDKLQVIANMAGATFESMSEVGEALLMLSPDIVAHVISLAAGEDTKEAREAILKLPFPVAIDALEKIGRLTFASGNDPRRVAETVIRMMQGLAPIVNDVTLTAPGLGKPN